MLRHDAEARRWRVRAVSTLLNTRIIRETPLRTHPNLAVVAALVSMWLISTAWIRPLALPDEGRYVATITIRGRRAPSRSPIKVTHQDHPSGTTPADGSNVPYRGLT